MGGYTADWTICCGGVLLLIVQRPDSTLTNLSETPDAVPSLQGTLVFETSRHSIYSAKEPCCYQVLTDELPAVLAAMRFKDSMRWRGDTAFSRPLRSLLALHGGAVLPFAFAGLRAGRITHGLRSEAAAPIEVI